ncbi:EAL domain-containing protein [Myxococcota bacterium]|nr:EAL domain-containing protein [Myxococcota bacterium]
MQQEVIFHTTPHSPLNEPLARALFESLQTTKTSFALLDASGTILYANRAWFRFGEQNGAFKPSIAPGASYLRVCEQAAAYDLHAARALQSLKQLLHRETDSDTFEYPCHGPDEKRWFLARLWACEVDGKRYIATEHLDITQRVVAEQRAKEATQQAEASQERFRLAVQATSDGLWDIDLANQQLYLSERFDEMLGYPKGYIPRTVEWMEICVHPEDRAAFFESFMQWLSGDQTYHTWEHRLRKHDGTYIWALGQGIVLRDPQGSPLRVIGATSDITHQREMEEKLRFNAYHDPLTGLSNRLSFYERLHQVVARFQRSSPEETYSNFALLLMDLDHFKQINDTFGHQTGDLLLKEIASRIKKSLRSHDTVARLGGDEFAILLELIQRERTPQVVAKRLLDAISRPVEIQGIQLDIGASIGIVFSSASQINADELLREADIALYRAKSNGRRSFVFYDQEMHLRVRQRTELEMDLRHSIERNELSIHLQPIISLENGMICSFEALLRWKHSQKGMISPAEFIPIAEECGFIYPLGEWVLREACRTIQQWKQHTANAVVPTISINTSAREWNASAAQKFIRPNEDQGRASFYHRVCSILKEENTLFSEISIELTESALLTELDHTAHLLEQLAQDGFHFMLDDFGTGYSSLSYLHRLPFHAIKLDRSFIHDLTQNNRSKAVFEGIVTMTRSLGIQIVAEGVETNEQRAVLHQAKVDKAQGYLFSPPLPKDKAFALWQEQRSW